MPPVSLSLDSDRRKIRQILVNLVTNAIKFTREGSVTLTLERAGDDVVYRVRDTGAGIAVEDRERIFEPFWQVERQTTRVTGGTGLGLSVTRRLVALLGGNISVESEVGRGSTFVVHLPSLPLAGNATSDAQQSSDTIDTAAADITFTHVG